MKIIIHLARYFIIPNILAGALFLFSSCGDLQESYTDSINNSISKGCLASECHESTSLAQYPPISGKHQSHLASSAGMTCSQCHYDYDDNTLHKNSILNGFNAATGTQMPGSIIFFDISLLTNARWDDESSTCSNIACHSDAGWYDTAVQGCTFCHGPGTGYNPIESSGSHRAHVNAGYSCETCHNEYTSNPLHKNGELNSQDASLIITFSDQGAWDNTSGTCSSLACHGDTSWYTPAETGCTFCHMPGSAYDPLSINSSGADGKHSAHVANSGLSCETCHNGYCDTVLHRNSILNTDENCDIVAFSTAGSWDNTTSTCSSLACHGTVSWYTDQTMGCTFCHGAGSAYDPSAYGKHAQHLNTDHSLLNTINCTTCHYGYSENPLHRNSVLNSNDESNIVSFESGSGTWDNSTGTCASLSCHGSSSWESSSSLQCQSCHESAFAAYHPDPVGTYQGRHARHVLSYGYQCITCHNSYNGEDSHLNGTNDVDNDLINLIFFFDEDSYEIYWNDTNNSCGRNGTGCHSKPAPGWDIKYW